MRIGTVKEIKTLEFRVGLTPEGVRELAAQGHSVVVESGAGAGIGLADSAYEEAGARVVASAAAVFENSDLIVKVKEPQPSEIAM
ncbi:MAG TPA: NAD(P)(+) transhydrogenase (Re/Si-specific) subunit alpha, partial [Rhizomicrobium sp.]|nr:NAD(P)(+) transhydrogenase (Re/Si-specific) subunit alpha [Rhizomicrobium sp.]